MHSTLDLSEIDAKIGRLFMVAMPGTKLDEDTERLIRRYCLGGVILFDRNIENPIQLATLCNDLQERAMEFHGIPLFLAVDQEGGPVARLKKPFTQFPGNAAIGNDPRPVDKAKEFARITAMQMNMVGLNMNLAPVVDVCRGKPEKHLAGRIFGDNPDQVALLGRTIVRVLQENHIMAVAKHFPGLGKTSIDPHHNLPTIEVDAREMEKLDLSPFSATISEGVSAVMTSHAIYPFADPDFPATLSHKILTGLLRDKLGFQGLIITDDLEMGAIKKEWGSARGAVMSFEAGADILLMCRDQSAVLESIETLKKRLIRGEISFYRLHQSVDRIMKAKSRFLENTKKVSLKDVDAYFGLEHS
ncbi:MAG TPA: beta-N-acetylhexosaminidase [Desulfobacteraceae bacterium]|nr:beta-N-acetylhexosaminidase [Desulfobacteraceae bacterium]